MITRRHGNLKLLQRGGPEAAQQLEREGWALLKGVFDADAITRLSDEINAVFDAIVPDRDWDDQDQFRHGMFNHSAAAQEAIGHPAILETIEPLLAEDCHVIANTAWRNVAGYQGGPWHIDAGPHIPRAAGIPWDDRIPYPIFAIGAHIFLLNCPESAGPTAVIPGSHRSGQKPPSDRAFDEELTYEERGPQLLTAQAGDVAFFVSDVWHRGMPAQEGERRFFLQAHYGRRDLAQRVLTTAETNHVTDSAEARAATERQRQLIGLHKPFFYDA